MDRTTSGLFSLMDFRPSSPVDAWLTVAATQGYGENALPAALDALIEFVEAHEEEWRFARATMPRSAVAAARL